MITKLSRFFSRAVTLILALLLAVGLLQNICSFEHKSYIAAFAAALLLFVGFCYLLRKNKLRLPLTGLSERRVGLLLAAVCILFHLIWILVLRVTPTVDFATFWAVANALAADERIGLFTYVAMFPHIFGYSWVLSLLIRLFGSSDLLAPVFNVLLTTGSCLLIYHLLLPHCGKNTAAAVSLFWILCPSKAIYNTMVISEPFYTNLLLLFFYAVQKLELRSDACCAELPADTYASAPSGRTAFLITLISAVCCGLLLRLLNAARPIAAIPIIAYVLWMLLLRHEKLSVKKSWLLLLVFAAVLSAVYFPTGKVWDRYVESKLGVEPSSFPGYSVYVGFNTESEGSYSDEDMDMLQNYVYVDGLTPEEAQQKMWEAAKERLTSGNINFPSLMLKKLATFLGNDEGGAYYAKAFLSSRAYSLLAVISNIYYYFLLLICFTAMAALLKHPVRSSLQLAPLYAVGLILAQMLVEVAGRYHYSLLPVLLLITGCGFSVLKPSNSEFSSQES